MAQAVQLAALLLLGLVLRASAGDCNDHGTLVDGKCKCQVPRPEPGAQGFTGDQCEVPTIAAGPTVSGPVADAAAGLGPLEPGKTVCFYTQLPGSLVDFGLRLQANDGAMLDLQGLLTSDEQVYPSSAAQNSFVISTTCSRSHVYYFLDKQSKAHYNTLFSCVTNKGTTSNATFTLRLAEDQCPFDISSDGNKTVCSGHGACDAGLCACTAEYSRPQAPVETGLGFEDCSAASLQLPDGPVPKQAVDMQMGGTWRFYNFSVSGTDTDRHLEFILTATANTTSDVELYLRYWQAPGRAVSTYDLRSDPGDFRRVGASTADLASSIRLDSDHHAYRPGVWFLGVFVNGDECVSHDLQLVRSACPNGCSGESRGTCAADTGTCTCKDDATGPDCSQSHAQLELNAPRTSAPRSGFAYDRLELPVGDTLSKAPGRSLSLTIQASFKTSSPLPAWVTARPMLLVANSADSDVSTALLRTRLQDADTTYSLTVDAAQVSSGTAFISIYNPIGQPYEIGYTVSASVVAACINDCSGHGTCGANDGVCTCQTGFAGADCSVDVDAIKRTQPCQEGSLHEQPGWQGPNGKGYAVCVCSAPEQCAYTDGAKSYVVCSGGFTVTGADASGIKLSDGRTIPAGGSCKKIRIGTSGGMVFFYCLLSVVLFCGAVVGSKFALERYQIWRANQVGGYNELGGDSRSLWDTFTGARRNINTTDSW